MQTIQTSNSQNNIIKSETTQREEKQTSVEENKGKLEKQQQIPFIKLFRFATKFDYILMAIGSIAAMAMGASVPAFASIRGQMTDSFYQQQNMTQKSLQTMLTFIYVGIGVFVAGWLMFACWIITGERQTIKCRKKYLKSLLNQQIGWFDLTNQNELSSNFAADTSAFQGAIGEKVAIVIMVFSSIVSAFIYAFINGWLMTLVISATVPPIVLASLFYGKVLKRKRKRLQQSYTNAGGKAQQAIAAIKTVKQLNGQKFQCNQYRKCLENDSKTSLKYSFIQGIAFGVVFFVTFSSYSLGFWYGSKCILGTEVCPQNISRQDYSAGSVLIVFYSILLGSFNLGQLAPSFKKIGSGRQAAAKIFKIIDRQPAIINPPSGKIIQDLKGKITFHNVTFFYPKDRTKKVLDNLNLEFDINKTGLVGQSGCGKSTILQLIMRFYDPDEGKITLDGYDLKQLDLNWLRKQIGYVSQQPVLFATSIRQNLLLGKQDAKEQQIIQALKMAQIWDFVVSLKDKLETYVGQGGSQISGGQKQRIAIARALLKKPKIMLLDEATSSLDRNNQKYIQATLQKVTQGLTTITVAHRFKTIMNSNLIYVLKNGNILQKGQFKNLTIFQDFINSQKLEVQKKDEGNSDQIKNYEYLLKRSASTEGQIQQSNSGKENKVQNPLNQIRIIKKKGVYLRILAYGGKKLYIYIAGIIFALMNGAILPIFSIFMGKSLYSLLVIDAHPDYESEINRINMYALFMALLGIAKLIIYTLQTSCFLYIGELITRNIRVATYDKILKMPVCWFDRVQNSTGNLTTRLLTDCNQINTMTTTTVSMIAENVSNLIISITIAAIYQWRTALMPISFIPLMVVMGMIHISTMAKSHTTKGDAYNRSTNLVIQAIINIRTVYSFGYQTVINKQYNQNMKSTLKSSIKNANVCGLWYGLSQFFAFLIFGMIFYFGALFIKDHPNQISVQNMFIAIYAINICGTNVGNNAYLIPDIDTCKNSARNIFNIQDYKDQDQIQIQQGSKLLKNGINGDILLQNVDFKYQNRDQYVFKNLNLKIKKGYKAAFVGTSGCGKSTIIQLLQRFYNPTKGRITINNIDIKDFDIHYLRSCLGVVSQQPVLFNGSFTENIKYNTNATFADVQMAAEKSNASSFILGYQTQNINENPKNPNNDNIMKKYERNVGIKGTHISGGQKQRIAIARIILRDPDILLLDQATSALDKTNQEKVQRSLQKAMLGRTTISVAHRLQTIKNSDQIFMFDKGVIVESGTYAQLKAKEGYFYNLEKGKQFI